MKVANQLASNYGDYSDCPGGPSVFTRVHKVGNENRWEKRSRCNQRSMVRAIQDRTQPAIVGFEDRSSHKPKCHSL